MAFGKPYILHTFAIDFIGRPANTIITAQYISTRPIMTTLRVLHQFRHFYTVTFLNRERLANLVIYLNKEGLAYLPVWPRLDHASVEGL